MHYAIMPDAEIFQTHPLPKGEVLSGARRHMRHKGNPGKKVAHNAEQTVKETQPFLILAMSAVVCLAWIGSMRQQQ